MGIDFVSSGRCWLCLISSLLCVGPDGLPVPLGVYRPKDSSGVSSCRNSLGNLSLGIFAPSACSVEVLRWGVDELREFSGEHRCPLALLVSVCGCVDPFKRCASLVAAVPVLPSCPF